MLQAISAAEFIRALRQIGYQHQFNQGPAMILAHPQRRDLAVPNAAELDRTVRQALIRAAGLTEDRFLELWRMSRQRDR